MVALHEDETDRGSISANDTSILTAARPWSTCSLSQLTPSACFLVREALVLLPPLCPYPPAFCSVLALNFTSYDATPALSEAARAGQQGTCAWCTLRENTIAPDNIIICPFFSSYVLAHFLDHLTRKKRFPSFSKSVFRMSTRRTRTLVETRSQREKRVRETLLCPKHQLLATR